MMNRDEYVQKLKSQLDQWNAESKKWEAKAQQAQHRFVVDAHLIERRDVRRDRAVRCLGERLAPERHLVNDRGDGWAVQADHLEL